MFLAIIVIIISACAAIIWSMYYNTISLQKSYGTVNGYYWAYYWAIASIERWLLMSKLKYPTYMGFWWFKWDTIYWSPSNWFSWEFRKLNQGNNSLTRSVNSQTQHISGTIDTKTIRTISFYKYDSNGNNKWAYWLNSWLTFSGTTNFDGQLNNWNIWNADFNRFIWLNNTGLTLRGLLTTNYSDFHEKDAPLTGNFEFNSGSMNPRPALSGTHIKK